MVIMGLCINVYYHITFSIRIISLIIRDSAVSYIRTVNDVCKISVAVQKMQSTVPPFSLPCAVYFRYLNFE